MAQDPNTPDAADNDTPVAKKATANKSTAKKAATKKATTAAAKKSTANKSTAKTSTAKTSTATKSATKKATATAAASSVSTPAAKAKAPAEPVSLTLDVVDHGGSKVGSVDLPAEWFDGDVNIAVMHQVVTAQLAAARQGTHKTKTRAQVAGGGRKPWRQKGTGRARQGSIRSPQWIGGGVAHGRVPKDWSVRVNKKVKRAALRSALTDRVRSHAIRVVRGFSFDTPKTKDAVSLLRAVDADAKALVVLSDWHDATVRSLRNLPRVHVLVVDQLNTHDVLNSDVVVFDEAAIELIGTGRRASTAAQEVGA
ncbi:MAG: 50S ribosomal protein L4 [Nitriliruptoraceae bacterium]